MEETITTPFLGRARRLHSKYSITQTSVAWMQTDRLDAASSALCQSTWALWNRRCQWYRLILLLKNIVKHMVRNALPGPQKMCSVSHKSHQIQQDDRHAQFGLGSDGLKSNDSGADLQWPLTEKIASASITIVLRFASKIRRPVLIRTSSKLRALDPKLKRTKASRKTS